MSLFNNTYLWTGLGGALGAMARIGMTSVLPAHLSNLPLRILGVNVLGCFIAGVLIECMAFLWNPSPSMQHFLIQGLLGGFTTFSAFTIEFGVLFEKGAYALAATYILLSVVLSISFFFIGLRVMRLFF